MKQKTTYKYQRIRDTREDNDIHKRKLQIYLTYI